MSEGSSQDQDLSAEVTELMGVDTELGPSRVNIGPELPVPAQTAVYDSLQPPDDGRANLYLGIEDFGCAAEVPTGERRKQRLDDFYVLL